MEASFGRIHRAVRDTPKALTGNFLPFTNVCSSTFPRLRLNGTKRHASHMIWAIIKTERFSYFACMVVDIGRGKPNSYSAKQVSKSFCVSLHTDTFCTFPLAPAALACAFALPIHDTPKARFSRVLFSWSETWPREAREVPWSKQRANGWIDLFCGLSS